MSDLRMDLSISKNLHELELIASAPTALKGTLILSSVFLLYFWNYSMELQLASATVCLVALIRFALIHEWAFFRDNGQVSFWNSCFNALTCIQGFLWGLIPPLAASQTDSLSSQAVVALVAVIGVAASCVSTLSPRPHLARAFIFFSTAPYLIWWLNHYEEVDPALPAMTFLFILYFWKQVQVASEKYLASVDRAEILHNLIHNIPLALTCRSSDRGREFLFVNRAAEKIWSLSQADIGKSTDSVFPTELAHSFKTHDSLAQEYHEPVRFPEFAIQLNGKEKILKKTTVCIHESQILLDIAEDISSLKEAEREISELQAVHMQAAKMALLGEMAAGVAHEINNPLAIIMGKAEQAKRLLNRTDPTLQSPLKQALDKIIQTNRRISSIVKGLLAFSKSGDSEPPTTTTAQQVLQFSMNLIEKKIQGAQIKLEIVPYEDVVLICQEQRLSQCLLNLLNNSVDAVANSKNKWIRIEVNETPSSVQFIVTDSGDPIPEEVRPKMMQPFFTTKEIGKGTGLGLSAVKGIVEEHGGKFYFNETAANTQFVIELPKYFQRRLTLAS